MNLYTYIKEIRKEGKRYFTLKQLMLENGLSRNAALNAIYRLKKRGELISPAKGLYVMVPPEHLPNGSIPPQELVPIIMHYLEAQYYVALLSAGLFHGATHQKSARFQVISDKRIKHPSTFGTVQIDYIYKKSVYGLPSQNFTVSTGYLKVATPELVALDLLCYPNHSGGLNHIATVFSELASAIDPTKLIKLAIDTRSEYQLQRIGYILDHIDFLDEKPIAEIIDILANYVKNENPKYLPLASEISKTGHTKCKKWKIIENTEIESDL